MFRGYDSSWRPNSSLANGPGYGTTVSQSGGRGVYRVWQDSETGQLPAFYPTPFSIPRWTSPPGRKTLASQPQEPWQSYSPPPADNHDTYGYPQQSAHGSGQAQANTRPGYPPQEYAAHEIFHGQGSQGSQGGYDPRAGYQGQQQDAQWQPPATGHGRTPADTRGFFGALFDFGFTSFVTPKMIKALYVLYTIWMVVWAVIFLRLGFKYGGAAGGIVVLIVVDPIFLLLTLGAYRVVLELFMVIHRMHDELRAIRENTRDRG